MYLVKPSLSSLQLYIWGYDACLSFKELSCEKEPDWHEFYLFLLGIYDSSGNSMGWKELIVNHCRGDEEQALKEFFKLYDRFTRLKGNNGGEPVSDNL
jgi:hypothetical protein